MTSKEALEILNNPTKKEHWDLQNKAYETLLDLVNRDTPMKVIKYEDSRVIGWFCPKCKSMVDVDFNGCPWCLQRLDKEK